MGQIKIDAGILEYWNSGKYKTGIMEWWNNGMMGKENTGIMK
jgi:hypothetical protein